MLTRRQPAAQRRLCLAEKLPNLLKEKSARAKNKKCKGNFSARLSARGGQAAGLLTPAVKNFPPQIYPVGSSSATPSGLPPIFARSPEKEVFSLKNIENML
jgi:hypothetical protein